MFGKVADDSFQNILDSTSIALNQVSSSQLFKTSSSSSKVIERPQQNSNTLFKLGESLGSLVQQQQQQQQQPDSTLSSLSQQQQQKTNPSRYKTELCRPFQENGACKYGEKCQFAHGHHELRSIARHPKYKTDLCRTYHSVGFCPYGPRCHFVHNLEEVKPNSSQPSPKTPAQTNLEAQINTLVANAMNSSVQSASQQQQVRPLPMFSNSLKLDLALQRQHSSFSESSNSNYSSSAGQSPSSSVADPYESDSNNSSTSARLPVFSTLSK